MDKNRQEAWPTRRKPTMSIPYRSGLFYVAKVSFVMNFHMLAASIYYGPPQQVAREVHYETYIPLAIWPSAEPREGYTWLLTCC